MESVNPNTYFLLVLRLSSNGQAQTRKALDINVFFSNDIKLMSFLLAALTVLRMSEYKNVNNNNTNGMHIEYDVNQSLKRETYSMATALIFSTSCVSMQRLVIIR